MCDVKIRYELAYSIYNKARILMDPDVCQTAEEIWGFMKGIVHKDNPLTKEEEDYLFCVIQRVLDDERVINQSGTRRQCQYCEKWTYAVHHCVPCIRKYLTNNFGNWTSGNVEVDELIRECQKSAIRPSFIIEWIPFERFDEVEYKKRGGCASVFKAVWKDGPFDKWNFEKQVIERRGSVEVILKQLDDSENLGSRWIEEARSHFSFTTKVGSVVKCFGLTRDPTSNDYMLVLRLMKCNLREYLTQNNEVLSWKHRTKIHYDIISSLKQIHESNAIHRDLHSGNILYNSYNLNWYISDLGFCGPVNLKSTNIYGNLPYIAPELLSLRGNPYKKETDIYSFGMMMWEVSSGKHPFGDRDYDVHLVVDIAEGARPPINDETPQWYTNLMQRCWSASPENRPEAGEILTKIKEELRFMYQEESTGEFVTTAPNLEYHGDSQSRAYQLNRYDSRIYVFSDLIDTEAEKQEGYITKQLDFII